jgi:hypothetical protein
MIDVETIDLADVRGSQPDSNGAIANNRIKLLALLAPELLGIVNSPNERFRSKDDGGGHDWPGHWSNPGFIDSGDNLDAITPQPSFVTEIRPPAHAKNP